MGDGTIDGRTRTIGDGARTIVGTAAIRAVGKAARPVARRARAKAKARAIAAAVGVADR